MKRTNSKTDARTRWLREYQRSRNAGYRGFLATLFASGRLPTRMWRWRPLLPIAIVHVDCTGPAIRAALQWSHLRESTIRNAMAFAEHRRQAPFRPNVP